MTSTACLRELIVPPRASSSTDPCLSHPDSPLDFVLEPHYIACVPSNSPIMSHCLPLNIFIPNSWSVCLAKIVSKCCPQPPLGEGGRPGAVDKSLRTSLFKNLSNQRKMALHCCAGFCRRTMQISHNYIHIYTHPLSLDPPFPPPSQ